MRRQNVIYLDEARAARQATAEIRATAAADTCRRIDLDDVALPTLQQALRLWRDLSGRDGTFRAGRDGDITDLFRGPLFGDRAMLLLMAETQPQGWLIGYYGAGLAEITANRNYLGRRFSELPGDFTAASGASLVAVLSEGRPAAHRICGSVLGRRHTADRLMLPIANCRGTVSRFITISEDLPAAAQPS